MMNSDVPGTPTMTINICLPPQLEAMVHRKLASGHYTSVSEVVQEALQLLEQRERLGEAKLERLRQNTDAPLPKCSPLCWDTDQSSKAVVRRGNAKRQD
jgi:antitoxin ParD1/3/4